MSTDIGNSQQLRDSILHVSNLLYITLLSLLQDLFGWIVVRTLAGGGLCFLLLFRAAVRCLNLPDAKLTQICLASARFMRVTNAISQTSSRLLTKGFDYSVS